MKNIEQARAYIANAPLAVSGSGGHNTTYKVACTLVQGFALSREEAMTLMNEYNDRLDEQWSYPQLRHKVDDATKAAPIQPVGYKLRRDDPFKPYKRTPPAPPPQRATWKITPRTLPVASII